MSSVHIHNTYHTNANRTSTVRCKSFLDLLPRQVQPLDLPLPLPLPLPFSYIRKGAALGLSYCTR